MIVDEAGALAVGWVACMGDVTMVEDGKGSRTDPTNVGIS